MIRSRKIENHSVCIAKRVVICIMFASILMGGCRGSDKEVKYVEPPPVTDTLRGISTNISVNIWDPRSIVSIDGKYLVILDYNKEAVFKVFKLPELEFLYGWGKKGEGPNSFRSYPSYHSINTSKGRPVVLSGPGPGLSTLKYYRVTDTALVQVKQKRISYKEQRTPFNNLQLLNDSLFVADYRNGDNEFVALRPGQKEPLFSFGKYPETDLKGRKKYRYMLKRNTSNIIQRKFAAIYLFRNQIKIFSFEGNLLHNIKVLNKSLDNPDFGDERYIYRVSAESNRYRIYTLSTNSTLKNIRKNPEKAEMFIEVWNWDGDLIRKMLLEIPKATQDFTIANNGKIYAYAHGKSRIIYSFEIGSKKWF